MGLPPSIISLNLFYTFSHVPDLTYFPKSDTFMYICLVLITLLVNRLAVAIYVVELVDPRKLNVLHSHMQFCSALDSSTPLVSGSYGFESCRNLNFFRLLFSNFNNCSSSARNFYFLEYKSNMIECLKPTSQ